MPFPGEFFKLPAGPDAEVDSYGVAMVSPADIEPAKEGLVKREIQVTDITRHVGDFTITLTDPRQWAQVGAVVVGNIIPSE